MEELFVQNNGSSSSRGKENEELDSSQYDVLLKGGEQVVSVLQEMVEIVSLYLYLLWFLFGSEIFIYCFTYL